MIKFYPLLYKPEMVTATMELRKTKTRRLRGLNAFNQEPSSWKLNHIDRTLPDGKTHAWFESREKNSVAGLYSASCPYGNPGDILWVRETWNSYNESFYGLPDKEIFLYKADGTDINSTWRPCIHMPKAACRLWLEVVSIKVERLQDISEPDAISEGIQPFSGGYIVYKSKLYHPQSSGASIMGPIESFKSLWISINGIESWKDNPWVWVIEFKKLDNRPKDFLTPLN